MLIREDFRQGRFPSKTWPYFDYREVDGVKVAFQVPYRTKRMQQVRSLDEVRINVPIDDGVFKEPSLQQVVRKAELSD
ncbi:MAG: hypothetical protein ABSD20_16635 [Terriglobales bacterium]